MQVPARNPLGGRRPLGIGDIPGEHYGGYEVSRGGKGFSIADIDQFSYNQRESQPTLLTDFVVPGYGNAALPANPPEKYTPAPLVNNNAGQVADQCKDLVDYLRQMTDAQARERTRVSYMESFPQCRAALQAMGVQYSAPSQAYAQPVPTPIPANVVGNVQPAASAQSNRAPLSTKMIASVALQTARTQTAINECIPSGMLGTAPASFLSSDQPDDFWSAGIQLGDCTIPYSIILLGIGALYLFKK